MDGEQTNHDPMMRDVATGPGDRAVARPLRVLVPLIEHDLEAAAQAGMPYYRAAGEKLLEAKSQLKHGEFVPWVQRHFKLTIRTAQHYMKLAEDTAGEKRNAFRFSSLNEFIRQGATPIGERTVRRLLAEGRRLLEDQRHTKQERQARQALAFRLIDLGYKALARELHPDVGGSRDEMVRLNAVRDELKRSRRR